ncbi:Hypothetical protein PHPALM_13863 [Phytophthora palmivora]|uniref:Uncharacterized protein n=1 Tax=Phytophthora palmivora TaxID=4796 RepID=A0A2P4XW95_9STRA|nr:Hypothetical protein PHPALM_13863 [Phytophthora palmivora]
MMRYLWCYEAKDDEWHLDDVCDQRVQFQSTYACSVSSTLARQVMKYDYGSEMCEYLCKLFEGREKDTTKLYTQRTLLQRLESASFRPGSDLAALDAGVGDVWRLAL